MRNSNDINSILAFHVSQDRNENALRAMTPALPMWHRDPSLGVPSNPAAGKSYQRIYPQIFQQRLGTSGKTNQPSGRVERSTGGKFFSER